MNRVEIRIRAAVSRRFHHCRSLRPECTYYHCGRLSLKTSVDYIRLYEFSSYTCDSAAPQSFIKLSVTSTLCTCNGTNFLAHPPRSLLTHYLLFFPSATHNIIESTDEVGRNVTQLNLDCTSSLTSNQSHQKLHTGNELEFKMAACVNDLRDRAHDP